MSGISTLADSVGFPFAEANTTSNRGVAVIAITGLAQSITFPKTASGLFYKIRVIGTGAEIQCGISQAAAAPTLVLDAASPWLNTSSTRGATLYGGEFIDGIIPGSPSTNVPTHFCFIGRSATGFIEVYASSCLNTAQVRKVGG